MVKPKSASEYTDKQWADMSAPTRNYYEKLQIRENTKDPDFVYDRESWDNEPSTVAEYSEGIGSLEVEPKDEKGVNWFAAVANQPKIIAEYFTEVLPGARRILSPVGSVEIAGTEALPGGEGARYHGLWDYFRNMKTTKLGRDDFVKISKNQSEENLIPYIENYINSHVLTGDIFVDALAQELPDFNIQTMEDIANYGKGNKEFKDYAMDLHKRMSESYMTEEDYYQDDDNYYVKNFKEIPGVNAAWTRFGDLQLPNLGIFKFDAEGKGSMLAPAASSYEGILGFDQLQDAGIWGMDETTPDIKYQGMFDQDNPATQAATQILGIPTSIATGNIKNILHTPRAIAQGQKLFSKPTRGFRGTPAEVSPGFGIPGQSRVPGIAEQATRETVAAPYTVGKLAWQNKGKVGAVAAPIGIASLWPE